MCLYILFSENVTGIPEPFDQLPSRMRKVNTFKTPEMWLYLTQTFEADVSQLFLLDLFLMLSFLPKLTVK